MLIFQEGFIDNLNLLIAGDKTISSRPLVVGKPSEVLIKIGADKNHCITITKKVVDKALRKEMRDQDGRLVGSTGHGLTLELIISALGQLDNPIMIFKGKENSLLIITSIIDQNMRNIVIAIELGRQEGFMKVISIRSIYGRDNLGYYISDNIEKGNLIAVNKEKADDMLRSIGKSYPKENTFISFN